LWPYEVVSVGVDMSESGQSLQGRSSGKFSHVRRDAESTMLASSCNLASFGVSSDGSQDNRYCVYAPISFSHSSSVSTATPSSRALVSFEPASSPATT
jgi:hypothetical protein